MAGAIQKTGMRVAPVSACIFTVSRVGRKRDRISGIAYERMIERERVRVLGLEDTVE